MEMRVAFLRAWTDEITLQQQTEDPKEQAINQGAHAHFEQGKSWDQALQICNKHYRSLDPESEGDIYTKSGFRTAVKARIDKGVFRVWKDKIPKKAS